MTALSETSFAKKWLEQFESEERKLVVNLIDELLLISNDDFVANLKGLIDETIRDDDGSVNKIALYAERPVKKVFGTIPSFFENARNGRAEGIGSPPIVVDPRDQEVGSEGIIANLITDFCRLNTSNSFAHPGPKKLRNEKINTMVIVTDFIGSGDRVSRMLESFRYVASLRSWKSYGLIKFIVLAYSGTSEGLNTVRSHKLKPEVRIVIGCPTVQNTFTGIQRKNIELICNTYPRKHINPLGYSDNGCLIAFKHGCPNNVPSFLHSRKSGWLPLFEGRSTSKSSSVFSSLKYASLDQRANNLLKVRESRKELKYNNEWLSIMLVLDSIKNGMKKIEDISSRSHLPIDEIKKIISLAITVQWLESNHHITQLGKKELIRLKKHRTRSPILASEVNNFYYPTQLRDS